MVIVHFCAGLDPWNGMANTARQFVAEERQAGHDTCLTNDWRVIERAAKLDCVHIHGTWLPVLWKVARLAKAKKAKLIIRPAGNYDPIRLRQGALKRLKKHMAGPWERAMLRRADVVQATCEAEASWIGAYLGPQSGPRPVVEITDLKRFFKLDAPVASRLGQRADGLLHLLFLGRASDPLKGVRYLKDAVRELNGAAELRIVSNAVGEELKKTWDWCDVLCLPTLSENFGRVVAEALERGRPVITTDGAPAWEPGGTEAWRHKLVYLKGFRTASDSHRVVLLKDALRQFAR